eukprot:TRINITY_DN2733_c0_g1_i3.p1 TRINITY_DN2733_c0_g1~~TRINITY_DN2733_c0_g1_i3.p1  ORF type:complete len:1100 (-),score=286.84 TRINITY_DN2733_c0_g1_i3:2012-5311(-)
MFLDKISSLGLLSHDEDSNILGSFPLQVKKAVIMQIVGYFALDPTSKATLTTDAHVEWVMECVGQGFALPIEEDAIMSSCIEIYKRWLLEPAQQPKPILEDTKQFFLQSMLKHMSLVFGSKRYSDRDAAERHSKLCLKALSIYLNLARTYGKKLSQETWEIWLKSLVGVTDQLLSGASTNSTTGSVGAIGDEILGQLLAVPVLKALFEIWLLSHNQNPAMWATLRELFIKNWSNWMQAIVQWNAVCMGLTLRVLALLYGPSEGTPFVLIKLDDTITLDVTPDHAFYSWHKMLHLIGNPNELQDSKIFVEAMRGLDSLVDAFLNVGTNSNLAKRKASPPDGNTILHIFGAWLFEAVKQNRLSFEEGTSLAVEILCCIFRVKRTTKFEPLYLASFYSCLSDVLLKDGRVLVSALLCTTNFFAWELEGSRVLIPYFLYAVAAQLTKTKTTFDFPMSFDHLRRACIKIFGTIISMANFFGGTELAFRLPKEFHAKLEASVSGSDPKAKPLPEITTYSLIRSYMTALLLKTLRIESNPETLEMLLWTSFVQLCEISDNLNEDPATAQQTDFHRQLVDLVLMKIKEYAWSQNVNLAAFKVMSAISSVYSTLPDSAEDSKYVVLVLSKYVLALLQNLNEESYPLIIGAYYCIADWIMTGSWILQNPVLISNLLSAIVTGINHEGDIREAAQYCLMHLSNNMGNFPTESGARKISSLVDEQELLNGITGENSTEAQKPYIRHFLVDDNCLLTLVDNPKAAGGPVTTVIIRNKAGKFAWDMQLVYIPSSEQPPQHQGNQKSPISAAPFEFARLGRKVDEAPIRELVTLLDKNKRSDNIIEMAQKQVATEKSYLEKKQFGLNHEIALEQPVPSAENMYSGECKFQLSRIFLSQMGVLTIENRNHFSIMEHNDKFLSAVKNLDQQPERNVQRIAVLRVTEGQRTESEVLSNQGGSADYLEFVAGMGWGVRVSSHPGYVGGLTAATGAEIAPYFANHCTETVFHVSTLILNQVEADKKKLLAKDPVVITWIEEDVDDLSLFDSVLKGFDVQIVVHPLTSGLYQIRYRDRDTKIFGIIFDNVVVRKEILAAVVRTIAQNAYAKLGVRKLVPF